MNDGPQIASPPEPESVAPPPGPPPGPTVRTKDTIGSGALTIFLWNLAHAAIGVVTLGLGIGAVLLAGFGLVALVYALPLALQAKKQGQRMRMKGMIIFASVGFLLTAACWGVLVTSLSTTSFH